MPIERVNHEYHVAMSHSTTINNSLHYRRRTDLEADGIACIFIELSPTNKNPIIVANIYREWQREGEPRSENEGPQMERWKKLIDKFKTVAASNIEFNIYGNFNLDRQKWRKIQEDDEDESEDKGYASNTDTDNKSQKRLSPGYQRMQWLTYSMRIF